MIRKLHDADSSYEITAFELATASGNLRKHLISDHIADWVAACDKDKISITAKGALSAVRKFRDEPEPTALESERPQYTKDAFVEALVELVVGDDLVCVQLYFDLPIY